MACTNELRSILTQRIEEYQRQINDLDTYETLCKLGDFGEFGREFLSDIEWLRDTWLEETNDLFDSARVSEIEDKLVQLPYEQAVMYREPDLRTLSLHEILTRKFGEDVTWRVMPETVMAASREDKLRVYAHFEYMCYFVINVREELLFEIRSRLGLSDAVLE